MKKCDKYAGHDVHYFSEHNALTLNMQQGTAIHPHLGTATSLL